MGRSIPLGHVAGVEIRVHWSWTFVLVLVAWTLGASVFPEQTPDRGGPTYAAMAVVASVLFFASIVLHELGHAVQARRDGVEIAGITLWLLGGVARLKGMFPTAEAELRIALAGPAVSLALGGLATAIAAGAPLGAAATGVASWLAYTNLILAAFNMLPALPLDGGRVLRALLWRQSGDLEAATARAASVGQVIGGGLVVIGLLLASTGASTGGLWLVILGWFVAGAAAAERRMSLVRTALEGLRVRDAMIAEPVTVDADIRIDDFLASAAATRVFTSYPVTSGGETVGLLPTARARSTGGPAPPRRVRDVMLPLGDAPAVDEAEPLVEAAVELASQPLHRALVCSDGRVVGLLSGTDVERLAAVRAGGRR